MYKYKVCEVSVKYRTEEELDKEIFAKNRDDVVDIFRQFMQEDIELEEMSYGLILNNRLKVIACINIGIGDTTNCVINTKKLLSACLICNGNAVIIAHNHPSGNLKPSSADMRTTEQLGKACEFLGIKLLDSLILTKKEFTSLTD